MSTLLCLGEKIPLTLLLSDGDETKYPKANIFLEDGSLFAEVNLTHLAQGLYTDTSLTTPTQIKRLHSVYTVYEDINHNTISPEYDLAEDLFEVVNFSNSDQYSNKLSTTFNTVNGKQEIIVWAEKNGQKINGANCNIQVKNSLGTLLWEASATTPNQDGVFRFENTFSVSISQNYYVVISIEVDGEIKVSNQSFFTVV